MSDVSPLGQLGWIVARDVNRTVGGGYAAMELLRRTFVARGWMTGATHGVIVAVSRLTPGTNVLAYCTAAGWRLRGWRGSAVALAAASVPSSIIIFLMTAALVRVATYRAVQAALAVGMLVACVLLFSAAWSLLEPYLRGRARVRVVAMLAGALFLYFAGLTPVRILLIASAVGLVMRPMHEPSQDDGRARTQATAGTPQ
jgi:chromate transporter